MSNKEILEIYINNGLLKTSVDCQFAKQKKDLQFRDDMYQDLCLILLRYPNEKLLDAHMNGHMNALVTKILVNQLWSNSSPYWRTYKRFDERSDEITPNEENTIVDDGPPIDTPDYMPNSEDDDHILHIKNAVRKLPTIQGIIFKDYCEEGSFAGVARKYGVSNVTAKNYITRIKKNIYDNL